MNKLVARFTALAALALGCSAPLSAATFDFTYIFGTGETATGSFEGTQNGNVVEDISNITLVLNGVAITGPLQATAFSAGWFGEAVVGFSVNDSNFIFTDRDPPPFDGNYVPGDHFFFIVEPGLQAASSYIAAVQVSELSVDANGGSFGWTLTERTTQQIPGVPDGASTAMLLGLALVGAATAHRRLAVARVG